jgi:hypothetical protein
MKRIFFLMALLVCVSSGTAPADPLHARANGAYWHHDSGWVFPEKVGEFVRVGIPQDVAGSPDAVAYYAREVDGVRETASVDVYQATSSAAAELEARPEGPLTADGEFSFRDTQALTGARQVYAVEMSGSPAVVGIYFISAGEWRIRVRGTGARLETLDAFARGFIELATTLR